MVVQASFNVDLMHPESVGCGSRGMVRCVKNPKEEKSKAENDLSFDLTDCAVLLPFVRVYMAHSGKRVPKLLKCTCFRISFGL